MAEEEPEDVVESRRLRMIPVSPHVLLGLIRGVYVVADKESWNLPDDVVAIDVYPSMESRCAMITIGSKEFTPVPDGERIPLVEPEVSLIVKG